MSLLICRDQCSAYATCISAADVSTGSVADAPLPDGPGEYYIVVGASDPVCGNYQLSITAPLQSN
jgi:hypothetical protein